MGAPCLGQHLNGTSTLLVRAWLQQQHTRLPRAVRVGMLLQEASETYLAGILGYEERPLVSTDYVNDARSSIVDAACTQVIDGTMVKIYAW